MLIKWVCLLWVICMLLCSGCKTLEEANKDAKQAGKKAGQVIRIPSSAAEGVSEGIAGESQSNPYNR